MAEGYVPTIEFIAKTLRESPEEKHIRNKSKFTEENVRKAIIELGYADKEGKYNNSEMAMNYFGHLGLIADQIINSFPESKSSSGGASSESKTKRKRRRGKGKGKSRRNRK